MCFCKLKTESGKQKQERQDNNRRLMLRRNDLDINGG